VHTAPGNIDEKNRSPDFPQRLNGPHGNPSRTTTSVEDFICGKILICLAIGYGVKGATFAADAPYASQKGNRSPDRKEDRGRPGKVEKVDHKASTDMERDERERNEAQLTRYDPMSLGASAVSCLTSVSEDKRVGSGRGESEIESHLPEL
jgi:hypothetical protein